MIDTLKTHNIKVKSISYHEKFKTKNSSKSKNEKELLEVLASDYSLEADVLERVDEEDETTEILNNEGEIAEILNNEEKLAARCIQEMKEQIEAGYGRQEVLNNIRKQFELTQEELLEIMQKYLITKGKVKLEKGKVLWNSGSQEGR